MDDDAPRLLCGTPELPPRCVALTFDDGPGPRSAELALMLREAGVPGTFFVLGESVQRYGHVLNTYRDCGHVIGLHGDRHRRFRSAQDALDDLSRCADRVRDYLDDTPWFRPPYGEGDWPVPGFAGPVGWHAQGRDWDITYRRGLTVRACVDAIVARVVGQGGGIVLLHDYAAPTEYLPARLTDADLDLRILEITKLLIERLREAGFTFVTLPKPAPSPVPQVPVARGPSAAEDMQNLRVFRSNAKTADGILDLLMPMRTGGDGPPLFCMHPLVGLSWCYIALLPYIDARYPLYGLQARGLRRPEPLPMNMEELARDFADQIRTTQPSGPYHLLGWSLGGNIAFAVAEELERRGEQVGLLAIMDALLSNFDAIENTSEPWMVYNLVLAQFGYVPALTPAEQDPEARMMELVRRRPGLGLDKWPDERVRALQRVISNNVRVSRAMRPGRVHCPLLFFAANRNKPSLDKKLETWRQYVDGPIEAIELDCDHRYMLLPQIVSRIGPALSNAMARRAAKDSSLWCSTTSVPASRGCRMRSPCRMVTCDSPTPNWPGMPAA